GPRAERPAVSPGSLHPGILDPRPARKSGIAVDDRVSSPGNALASLRLRAGQHVYDAAAAGLRAAPEFAHLTPETPLMADAVSAPLLDAKFLAQLEQLELVSRKIFLGRMKGERRSKRKGQSVEFADYRNYVVGDDLRFLDWNLYARLDRLFLRLFMEEEDLHFYVLIDNSLSMGFGDPTKLHY